MKILTYILIVIHSSLSFDELSFPYQQVAIKSRVSDLGPGEPLILTPLLEENRIEEAQDASEVHGCIFGDVKSYSGYFTVDKVYDSNLFFWFFPAYEDYENAPVVLWLQGGPGATSMIGLFAENGPFVLKSSSELDFRQTTWAKYHSIFYIDNPVGTGFSFTNGGYARNETKVGEDLYAAIQQFFTLFPNLRKNEFYVTGESYAGKYVPAVSYQIYQKNSAVDPEQVINLQGLAIGNGLSDPERQLIYSDRLYQLGLIDSNTKVELEGYEELFVNYVRNESYYEALICIAQIKILFSNATGFVNDEDFLLDYDEHAAILDGYMAGLFNNSKFRKSIHVGNVTFGDPNVNSALQIDIPKSVTPWVSELLSNYRVLLFSGQLDIVVPYTQTTEYLNNLNFSSAEEYKVAPRYKWYVDGDLAGYVKVAGNLTEVLVRNAGHRVPSYQPEWTLDLITKFTRNQNVTVE